MFKSTAYLDLHRVKGGYICDVVSEQDYHERGPFAHSHRTAVCGAAVQALSDAKEWAEENGYSIVSVDDIA